MSRLAGVDGKFLRAARRDGSSGQSQTKVKVRGRRIGIRFGDSDSDQAGAHAFMSAIRDGELERQGAKPHVPDGKKILRVLLFGLHWKKYDLSAYAAQDGAFRSWHVGRDCGNARTWGAYLHDGKKGSPHKVATGLPTLRAAKVACEEAARRMNDDG